MKIADANVTTAKLADSNVTTAKLADGSVTGLKLADGSVNGFKLVDGSVSTSKIVNGDVTTLKLSDDSVTTIKILNSNVTTSKIADANVTNAKLDKANIPLSGFGAPTVSVSLGSQKITDLANPTLPQDGATKAYVDAITVPDGSITTAKLADGSVTTLKIADANVTTAKLADSNITTAKLANSNVTTEKLADSSVTNAKLANDSVNINKLADGSVSTGKLQNNAVTTLKLNDGSVTTAKIADANVTTSKIADANVTNAKLDKANIPLSGFGAPTVSVSLGSQKITDLANPTLPQDGATKAYVDAITFTVPDGSITTAKLADSSVTTLKIADANVTTAKLADSNVTTAKLADSSVTTVKLASSSVTNAKLDKLNIPLSGFGAPIVDVPFGNIRITDLANPTNPQDGATKAYVDAVAPAIPSLQQVIDVSDVLNGEAPTGTQFIGYNGETPIWTDLPAVTLESVVVESPDLDGSPPTINQVIKYDGEFVVWSDIPAPTIADGSITTAKLADSSVTNAKLDKANIPLSGFGTPTVSVLMGSQKISNLANPTLPQDGATKAYVDSVIPNTANFATLNGQNTFTSLEAQEFTNGGIRLNNLIASALTGSQNIFTTKQGGSINLGSASSTTSLEGSLNLGTFGSTLNMKNIQTLDYTNADNDSLLNTITNTTGTNVNINLTRLGQTQLVSRSANSGSIPNNTDTTLFTTTVLKTGIYTLSYQARYFAYENATVARGVQTWMYVSSPAAYGQSNLGQLGLNLVGYASPYLNLQNVGVSMVGAWTGLINANATVALRCYIEYNGSSNTGALIGGISSNYLTFTRIA